MSTAGQFSARGNTYFPFLAARVSDSQAWFRTPGMWSLPTGPAHSYHLLEWVPERFGVLAQVDFSVREQGKLSVLLPTLRQAMQPRTLKMKDKTNASRLLLNVIAALGVLLPFIAAAKTVFSLERVAVHLIIAAYSYWQVRQYLLDGNMLSAFGRTLTNDQSNTLERRAYATLFATALLTGVVLSASALL